jgi:hypothetical protein
LFAVLACIDDLCQHEDVVDCTPTCPETMLCIMQSIAALKMLTNAAVANGIVQLVNGAA